MEQARQRKKLQERRGARQKKRAKRATRAANAAQAPPGGADSLMRETEDLRQQMTRLTPKMGPTAITAQDAGSQALPSPVNPASLRYLGSQTQPAFPDADCEFV